MKAMMAISTAQAMAVARAEKVSCPKADNESVKIGAVSLKRLPVAFRKHHVHAHAYRLVGQSDDLQKFFPVVNAAGRGVCIVYKSK